MRPAAVTHSRFVVTRLDVSYETVRRWVLKFGPMIARNL
jgi:transposase-like protein